VSVSFTASVYFHSPQGLFLLFSLLSYREGAYRQVFALEHPFENEIEKVAIKDLHYE
jgi:hypothetical protein